MTTFIHKQQKRLIQAVGTIPSEYPAYSGKTVNWFSTDSQEKFQQNGDNVPDRYAGDCEIEYRFNSQGCRGTTEFVDLTAGEFLLAMGCSYTQGVGMHQSETWCEQLASRLNQPCMNLAQQGTGIDYSFYQTINYINSPNPLPNCVIIQHSEQHRRLNARIDTVNTPDPDTGELVQHDDVLTLYIDHVRDTDIFLSYSAGNYINAITLMWNGVGVPVIHWTFSSDTETPYTTQKIFQFPRDHLLNTEYVLDLARDCTHNGPGDHRCVADNLEIIRAELFKRSELCIPAECDWFDAQYKQKEIKQKIMDSRNRSNIIYN